MSTINVLNRVTLGFVLAIIVCVSFYGYYSIVTGVKNRTNVTRSYDRSYAFRSVGVALTTQRAADLMMWTDPTPSTRAAALLAARQFDTRLAALRAASHKSVPYLDRIAAEHRRLLQARDAVSVAMASEHSSGVRALRTAYQPLFHALDASLATAYGVRFAHAVHLDQEESAREGVFLVSTAAIRILALIILVALLYLTAVYKRRADRATDANVLRLEAAALTDSLTGLRNYRAFHEDLGREVQRVRRQGAPTALALIDIDSFKSLNDARGHRHGDEILVGLARILRSGRGEDIAYRLGGDEFAVLFVGADENNAAIALERMRVRLRSTFRDVTVSIGVCEIDGSMDEEELYEIVDAALYTVKADGRDAIVRCSALREQSAAAPSRKVTALMQLLDSGKIDVAFQPIWKLSTTSVLGYEALARIDPRFGIDGPQEAFELAERARKIFELDALCVRNIIAAAKLLPKDALLFLNVAPQALTSESFRASEMAELVSAAGLHPSRVVVEFTERRVLNTEALVERATEMQRAGFRIALDDAGVGYAGLELLGRLSLDYMKVDRSIVRSAKSSIRARGLLAGIIAIARTTGAFLIVEGIESGDELESLDGIDGVQGFFLGEPRVGIPDFSAFAKRLAPIHNTPRKHGIHIA